MTLTDTQPRNADQLQKITDAVRSRFSVSQEFLRDEGAIEYRLDSEQSDVKSKFRSLIDELRQTGDSAFLRKTDQGPLLLVFRKPLVQTQRLKRPLILLAATLVTIFADGLFRAYYYFDPMVGKLPFSTDIGIALVYMIALIGIIGIHELGHKVASWYHKMNSSWPYFIPGIPSVWPTMGAVISSRDPPVNRDSLFDLGLSGPLAGLLVTVGVSIAAVYSAILVPASSVPAASLSGTDFYTAWLVGVLRNSSPNSVLTGSTFNLLFFAYSIGFLLTFVNLLPAWQLDGGHVANSAVSPRTHQVLTWVSAFIMILSGFFLMAILVLLLSGRTPSLRPLDDISPLSRNRKVMFALTWVLSAALYAFMIYNNPFFFQPGLFIH